VKTRGFVPAVAIALLVAGVPVAPTSAQPETTPVAEVAAQPALDARVWCRPVVFVGISPDPLTCWLTLVATAPGSYPVTLTGMNMGDLPPFTELDVVALTAALERFAREIEEARLEAERAAAAARRSAAAPRPAAGSTGSKESTCSTCSIEYGYDDGPVDDVPYT
jgi:hypothetical protein